ncbi:hypothetical protein HQ590_07345, partial [bacterium]|nr:hypothetical protein [bacterium]
MQSRWRLGLAAAVLGTLVAQLWLCYFFSGGELIPRTIDVTPASYHQAQFHFPPQGSMSRDYWLGLPIYPVPLTPHSVLAHLPPWWFFTVSYPLYGALAVLTFYLYIRRLGLNRTVAILGGLAYGWQGPLLSNVFGGHFAPAALLALFPLAGWGAHRAIHGGGWAPAAIGGAVLG